VTVVSIRSNSSGFTLIEVMIVVFVVAVLLAIALPAYHAFVARSHRGDAIASLLELSLAQEKWRAGHTGFGSLSDVWTGNLSREGHYVLSLPESSANSFLAVATPKPGGAQDGDHCGAFAMNQDGPVYIGYAGTDCWER
jgi:type IV pilus assembly protein PilE